MNILPAISLSLLPQILKAMEKFTFKGYWFLPNNKDERVYGTLTFDPHEGAELELYGSFSMDIILPEHKDQSIILGLTSDSKQVTLYNCMMTHSGGAKLVIGEESGKPSIIYSPLYCMTGLHADSIEDLKFDSVSSEIFNLDEWLRVSGFSRNIGEENEDAKNHISKIHYKLPDQVVFPLSNDLEGKFNFSASRPGMHFFQKQATIKQSVAFEVYSSVERNFSDLLEHVFTFQNFLVLALYGSTYPKSVTLRGQRHTKDYGDGIPLKKEVKLFFSMPNAKLNEREKSAPEMIFSYAQIKDRFPVIIRSWFEKYELLEPAFDLVFEQFYNSGRFSVNTFLNLAQSAETFHARVHNHPRMNKVDYQAMKRDILKLTPTKYHKWLGDQFSWGNSLRLHDRLTELTDKYANSILDKILRDKNQFVQDVKRSRNYYTHYSDDGKKHALKGSDLFYLSEKLKILLVCSFLMEVGLTKEELSKSMDNLKWKLFSHIADWSEELEQKRSTMKNIFNLKGGVLIIGSLLWDEKEKRASWRNTRLDQGDAIHVKAPIRYGRLSSQNIYTMVFSNEAVGDKLGSAFVMPFKGNPIMSLSHINTEAIWLAMAEGMKKAFIACDKADKPWCVIGILFNENKIKHADQKKIMEWWHSQLILDNDYEKFHVEDFGLGDEDPSIQKNGLLNFPWLAPVRPEDKELLDDFDFVIATATVPTNEKYPNAEEVSDLVKADLTRRYFYQNVENGITTFQDDEIRKCMSPPAVEENGAKET